MLDRISLIDVQILPVFLLSFGQFDVEIDARRAQLLVRLRRQRIVAQVDQLQRLRSDHAVIGLDVCKWCKVLWFRISQLKTLWLGFRITHR